MSMLSRRTWKLSHQAFLGFGYTNKPPLNSSSSQILILLLLVPRSVTTATTDGKLPRHHCIGQEEENGWQRFQQSPNRTNLTPQIVKSTLLNCPSDLIALTFFFWCARQRDYFHDRFSFHHMVDILTRLTNRFGGSVKDLLHHLNAVGIVTGPQVLMLLLRIYWHGRKDVHVIQTFEEIICHGYTPNTYARNICMDVLFKIERVTMALEVLKGTPLPNFLTYSIALSNLCRLGDLINLPYVLRSMLRAGYYPNADTFYVLLSCFCKRGKVAEALQLYSMMMTLGVPVSVKTWSILIDGFCKSGRLVMAGHVLDKMVESGCFPNVVTWTSFIKAFMESGNLDASLSVLRLMELEGHSPDLVLYNVLIDGLSKTGRYDDALDCYVQLVKQKLIPDSYTFCSVMSLVSLSRKFDLLPTLFSGLSVETDLVVFNSILSFFCKTGCPSGAVEFYDNMVERGLLPDKYSFSELLRGLCGAGRTDTAVNVYRRIVMEDVCVDAHVHTIIIDGLIKSGNLSTAITLFREAVAKKYPLDVVSYTVAINGLLKADRSEEAYTLYNQMKASGITPNAKTHNAMVSGLCRGRDVEKVRQILQEMIDAGTQLNNSALNRINNLLLKACCSPSIRNQLISLVDSLMPHSASSLLVVQGNADSVDVGSISSHDELHDVAASVG